jgi:nitrate reductase gamma subunit
MDWLKRPMPFPVSLFPLPSSSTGDIVREGLLLTTLQKGDNCLWKYAWAMHISLFMVLGGHIVGISTLGHQFTIIGFSPEHSKAMSAALGNFFGIVLLAGLIALFYRRTSNPDVKRLSNPADYFDVIFLMAIVITGMHMRFASEFDLAAVRSYLGSVITFSPMPIPEDWLFISHYLLVLTLMIYFPFSKLIHSVGFFVSRALINEKAPVYPTVGSFDKMELSRKESLLETDKGGVSK